MRKYISLKCYHSWAKSYTNLFLYKDLYFLFWLDSFRYKHAAKLGKIFDFFIFGHNIKWIEAVYSG